MYWGLIPWIKVDDFGHFVNYKYVLILRNNLKIIIILDRERLNKEIYVFPFLFSSILSFLDKGMWVRKKKGEYSNYFRN